MNYPNTHYTAHKGFSLIEIVLAVAIFTMFFVSISLYYRKMHDVSEDTRSHIQSGLLIEEGFEVVGLFRGTSWDTYIAPLATGTPYYLHWSGTDWSATTTPELVENIFTRTFTLSDVYRDASSNIGPPTGTYDPGTKKLIVNISWLRRGNKTQATDSGETYITNLFHN